MVKINVNEEKIMLILNWMDRILIVDCFQWFYNSTYHEEKVHAINEVVHNDPVQSVGVPLEAAVHGAAGPGGPVVASGLVAFLLEFFGNIRKYF